MSATSNLNDNTDFYDIWSLDNTLFTKLYYSNIDWLTLECLLINTLDVFCINPCPFAYVIRANNRMFLSTRKSFND